MLGGLEVEVAGELRPLPALGRARSLLAYLALNPEAHPRGVLAALFWPDVLDESARTSLRTALSAVRKSLGDEGLLVATRDAVSLAAGWTDAREVERLIAAGRPEEALALYRGPSWPASTTNGSTRRATTCATGSAKCCRHPHPRGGPSVRCRAGRRRGRGSGEARVVREAEGRGLSPACARLRYGTGRAGRGGVRRRSDAACAQPAMPSSR